MNRRLVVLIASVSFVVAALGLGWWGLQADRGDHAHAEDGNAADWVLAGDGWVRVTSYVDRTMAAMRMPGMATMPDPDPVADGFTRVSIGVELAAGERPLPWRPKDFVVTGQGTEALTPHDLDLGDGVVPPGSRVAGGLIYDVPEEATDLVLAFAGGTAIPLAPFVTPGEDHHDDHDVPADDQQHP